MEDLAGVGKGITRLVEYGVVGVVLALALAGLAYLYREIRAINTARVEELRQVEKTIGGILDQVENVARENSVRLKESVERFALTMHAHSNALENNTKMLEARNQTMLTVERAIAEWVSVSQKAKEELHETLDAIRRQVVKSRQSPKE
jgi:uncharacterized protein Yka (UPF0111/DUF47 family)